MYFYFLNEEQNKDRHGDRYEELGEEKTKHEEHQSSFENYKFKCKK
jgi:hypothetical protein